MFTKKESQYTTMYKQINKTINAENFKDITDLKIIFSDFFTNKKNLLKSSLEDLKDLKLNDFFSLYYYNIIAESTTSKYLKVLLEILSKYFELLMLLSFNICKYSNVIFLWHCNNFITILRKNINYYNKNLEYIDIDVLYSESILYTKKNIIKEYNIIPQTNELLLTNFLKFINDSWINPHIIIKVNRDNLHKIINMILRNYDNFAEGLNESIEIIKFKKIGMCNVKFNHLKSNNDNDKLLINIYTLFSILGKYQIDTTTYTLERIKANLLNYMKLLNNISLILYFNKKYNILFKIIEYANIFFNIHEILNNTTNKTYEFKIKSGISSKYKNYDTIDRISLMDFIFYINKPLYVLITNREDILSTKSTDETEKEKLIIFIKKEICSILMEDYIEKSKPQQYIQLKEQRICSVLIDDYEDINIYSYKYEEYFKENIDANNNVIAIIKILKEKFNENLYESIKKINDNTSKIEKNTKIIKDDKIEMLMNVLDNIVYYIDRNHTIPIILNYLIIIGNINIYLYLLNEYDNLIINLEFYNLLNFINNIRFNNNIKSFKSIDFKTMPEIKVYTSKKEFNKYLLKLSNGELNFSLFNINTVKEKIANYIDKLEVISPPPAIPNVDYKYNVIHDITNFDTFTPYMKSDKLLIIIYYKDTLNDDILKEYTTIATNNTNDKIIFLKININDKNIKDYIENHVNIESLPAIMIFFKNAPIYILTANIIDELNDKMIELKKIMIDYDTTECTEIISQGHIFILKHMFDIVIIKIGVSNCPECAIMQPHYYDYAKLNKNKNIIYTEAILDKNNLMSLKAKYKIRDFPALIILNKNIIINTYYYNEGFETMKKYLSSDTFIRFIKLLSDFKKGGGNNKYKKYSYLYL